jgi:hypothetical protein
MSFALSLAMLTRRSFFIASTTMFLLATSASFAHADEAPPATVSPAESPPPPEDPVEPPPPPWNGFRFQLDVGAGFGFFHRTNPPLYIDTSTTPSTPRTAREGETGFELGLAAHVHPHPIHGAFLGWSYTAGIFGPTVNIVSAGYSVRVGAAPRLRKVTLDGLFDFGPAVGYVTRASESPDHFAIGGHVGAGLQLYIWNFYVGVRGTYDLGFSTAPTGGLDGAVMFKLDLGFAVDAVSSQ